MFARFTKEFTSRARRGHVVAETRGKLRARGCALSVDRYLEYIIVVISMQFVDPKLNPDVLTAQFLKYL